MHPRYPTTREVEEGGTDLNTLALGRGGGGGEITGPPPLAGGEDISGHPRLGGGGCGGDRSGHPRLGGGVQIWTPSPCGGGAKLFIVAISHTRKGHERESEKKSEKTTGSQRGQRGPP